MRTLRMSPFPTLSDGRNARLMLIHLADSNRQMPGMGHIDFTGVIRELDAIGFEGYLSLDCLARQTRPQHLFNAFPLII